MTILIGRLDLFDCCYTGMKYGNSLHLLLLLCRWWSKRSKCVEDTSQAKAKANTASELNISNMFGVFIVLIAFTVIAILYEIGYAIWKIVRSRRKKKVVIVM